MSQHCGFCGPILMTVQSKCLKLVCGIIFADLWVITDMLRYEWALKHQWEHTDHTLAITCYNLCFGCVPTLFLFCSKDPCLPISPQVCVLYWEIKNGLKLWKYNTTHTTTAPQQPYGMVKKMGKRNKDANFLESLNKPVCYENKTYSQNNCRARRTQQPGLWVKYLGEGIGWPSPHIKHSDKFCVFHSLSPATKSTDQWSQSPTQQARRPTSLQETCCTTQTVCFNRTVGSQMRRVSIKHKCAVKTKHKSRRF